MADSYTDFGVVGDLTAEQITGVFDNLTIDYISTAHFSIVHTSAATGAKTAVANANLTVATTPTLKVTIDSGVTLPLAAADTVRVIRTTPITNLQRTFSDGSVLKASDLNTQTKQLLFGLQEQVDQGIGSLPLDTDGKFDAGSKGIKNLITGTGSSEAVTKEYVDNASLYGGAYAATEPQAWTFTAAGADVEGTDRVYDLTGPLPSGDADNMYLIEVGGVLQNPSDYNVIQVADGVWSLTLLQASSTGSGPVDDGVVIHVRNFGASRNVVQQPYIAESDDAIGFVIKGYSPTQSENLLEAQQSDGTRRVEINACAPDDAATLKVTRGADTSNYHNAMMSASDSIIQIEAGAYGGSGGSAGAMLKCGDAGDGDYGRLLISNKSGSGSGNEAIVIARGGADPVYCFTVNNNGAIYGLNLTTKNDVTVGGNLDVTGTSSLTGDITALGDAQINGDLLVKTDFEVEGNAVLDQDLVVCGQHTLATGHVIKSADATTATGAIQWSSNGPYFRAEDGSAAVPYMRLYTGATPNYIHLQVGDGSGAYIHCDNAQVKRVAEPTVSNDAATKNYVDKGLVVACAAHFTYDHDSDRTIDNFTIVKQLGCTVTRSGNQQIKCVHNLGTTQHVPFINIEGRSDYSHQTGISSVSVGSSQDLFNVANENSAQNRRGWIMIYADPAYL